MRTSSLALTGRSGTATIMATRYNDNDIGIVKMAAAAFLAAIVVAALYFGRDVFVPIALAIILSFVLAPLTRLFQGWGFPRSLSVITVVFVAFAAIFGLGGLIASEIGQLAGNLPRYQATMEQKIKSLRGPTGTTRTLERAADVLQDLRAQINKPKTLQSGASAAQNEPVPPEPEPRPVPVEVRQPPPSILESLSVLISPLLHPVATTGIIVIFVIFILLQREDLRNRFIKLAGSRDLQKTTAALDDAARRLSRLFLAQLALNAIFGVVIGMVLWAIGVPSPILWGILAAVLRFVPYVGAVISAVFPLTLAAAVDPGWSTLLWTAALFLIIETITGQVIEPLFHGRSTGLSPVAIIASATFWVALWGPIGLVLSTPLTVCLVVLGRHVERLAFLDVMFGDRPALSPPEIFYQRMLAGDPSEAVDKAEEFLKERSLTTYYDEVALKGLTLAQHDVTRGSLDHNRIETIRASVVELVEDLVDQEDRKLSAPPTNDAEAAAAIEPIDASEPDLPVLIGEDLDLAWRSEKPLLCAGGSTGLDEAVAVMLAQLLAKHGMGARTEPAAALTTPNIFRLETVGVMMTCICYLDTSSSAHMRYTVRRVRRKFPHAKILLISCLTEGDLEALAERTRADAVVSTLRSAVKVCLASARNTVQELSEPHLEENVAEA
jgi:predicted PurR-regulated permease PerM